MAFKPTYAELQQTISELIQKNNNLQDMNASLLEKDQILRALLSTPDEIFTVVDKEARILFINSAAARQLGSSPEELIGQYLWDFFSRDIAELRMSYSAEVLRRAKPLRFEDQRKGIYYDNIFYPIIDTDGSVSRTLIIARNITRSKKIEQELRQNEEKYRLLFDNEKDAILLIDTETSRLIDANTAAVHLYGFSKEELLKMHITELSAEADAMCGTAIKGNESNTKAIPLTWHRKKDGTTFPVEISCGLFEWSEFKVVCAIVRDITERHTMEHALRESEALHRATIDSTADGILVVDQTGKITHANDLFTQMWRIPQDLIETRDNIRLLEYVADQLPDPQAFLSEVESVYDTSTAYFDTRTFKDGRIYEQFSSPLIIDEKVAGRVWSFRDITAYKQAEQKLRESEEIYRTIFENTGTAVAIIEDDGIISLVNAKFESLSGCTREEIEGRKTWMDFTARRDMERVRLHKKQRMTSPESTPKHYEFCFVDAHGRERDIFLTTAMIPGTTRYVSSLMDITEKKRLEAQFLQRQKLEAIGTLAGGIAHDFNNILAAIIGYTELTLLNLLPGDRGQRNLQEVLKAGQRAKELVQRILTFSRQAEPELKPVLIQEILAEALKLLRPSIPSTIRIVENIDDRLGTVLGDPIQIHQLIVNLCTNAFHAMEHSGGTLEITVSPARLNEEFVRAYPKLAAGPYLQLRVRDTGCGMDGETIKRIFDPFFTTRETGKGTGLGLAIVHGIVTSLEGVVLVQSEPHKGSTFDVYLPIFDNLKAVDTRTKDDALPRGRGEHVLLVDDEESLVDFEKQLLEFLGYRVTAHTSSAAAFAAFEGDPHAYDLIFTDMTMPEMTGSEMAEKVFQIRPDMPIIICSGYSERLSEDRAKEIGIREYVMKPLANSNVAEIIHRVLNQ